MLKKIESWAVPFSIQRPWWWWRLAFWVIQVSECHCKGHFNHKSWCWSWNCSTKEYTSKNQKPKQKPRKKRQKQASKQTNKTSKKKPPKFDKMRHTTNNTRFAIDLSWKDQFYVFKGMWHTIRYYYCKREREIFMISKVLMVFFKWMSSIWITCMIYGLFSDINTIDTLNYEYQLRTFWKTHAYDTLRLIMGLYNFWGVHAREKLHKHYKATKLLERHTISRSGWQKGNRWMKTKQQTPSWVRGKGMYIWGAMIRVESAPNVIKGLS